VIAHRLDLDQLDAPAVGHGDRAAMGTGVHVAVDLLPVELWNGDTHAFLPAEPAQLAKTLPPAL
jgi:hypothetical protein